MESKQEILIVLPHRFSHLLIEPVWNRNDGNDFPCRVCGYQAFNRTSMESKRPLSDSVSPTRLHF